MNIRDVTDRNQLLTDRLLQVWEDSVRATHVFLSDMEIENIKKYVPQALQQVSHLIVAENAEQQQIAFMGLEEQKIEMLFVSPQERGHGLGKTLVQYGITNHAVSELAVNEQNPLARGFYEHLGFYVYKRTDEDEQGNPYPLLYMRLN